MWQTDLKHCLKKKNLKCSSFPDFKQSCRLYFLRDIVRMNRKPKQISNELYLIEFNMNNSYWEMKLLPKKKATMLQINILKMKSFFPLLHKMPFVGVCVCKVLQCPSGQELVREQLASRAAAWDRAARTAGLPGPFIYLLKYYSV